MSRQDLALLLFGAALMVADAVIVVLFAALWRVHKRVEVLEGLLSGAVAAAIDDTAARGRDGQGALGRHSAEYQRTVTPDLGLHPVGQAGRVDLQDHLAQGLDVDRGDRYTWAAPRDGSSSDA